ncbi:MAG: glycosyltransferase family 4 protein [Actinomycetota bacterium]|nr:glycosyltransferase family 4 protein [Actinomycetota bacterium]
MTHPQNASGSAAVVPLLLGVHWHDDFAGGLDRYVADLLASLRRAGLSPRAALLGPARTAPVGVSVGAHLGRPLIVRLWCLRRAAGRAAVDATVVDAHFALHAFWPVVLGRLRRLPLVVHFQGPWADESAVSGDVDRWRVGTKRMLERAVYRRAREVVVLSTPFKRLLVERCGVIPWRVHVIPPGVDLVRFRTGDRANARDALGLPADVGIAVSVRRLVPRMGLDVLLEAWRRVLIDHADALLVVVGDGPERPRLKAAAARLGVSGAVRFIGRVDDETLVRCYQAADVSVVPTVALEGFGLVVLESLACGTPVVVTDSGGLPEAVAGLDPGLVVPAADAGALAQRVSSALEGDVPSPEGCRSHAASFDWARIAERHREIYERAVAPPARGRLRVVFLDHCAQLSGGELALLRLLPALGEVDAHVILAEDGPLEIALAQAGVSVEVLPMDEATRGMGRHRVRPGTLPAATLVGSGAYTARLALRLRRFQPDLVHTNSLKAALYGAAAARLAGVPVVWHLRDRISADYLPPAACRLVRGAARLLPAGIIANSRSTLETLGRAGAKGVVVSSPVNFERLAAVRSTGASTGGVRAGMVGRLAPWKGQHVFLQAFARAFPYGDERAAIVGSALFGEEAYEQSLRENVHSLGLDGRVEFKGFKSDVSAELAQLDVLVHASTIPEPFGQVVVEGMAAGLPVVAADAGGPAEVVEHNVNGMLYAPGDVDALAKRLRELAADPETRRRLGNAGRVRAADFSPERVAAQVMTVYRGVLDPAAPGS